MQETEDIGITEMPEYLAFQKLVGRTTISFAKIRNELNKVRAKLVEVEADKEDITKIDVLLRDNLDLEKDSLSVLIGEFNPAWDVLSPTIHNKKEKYHRCLEKGEAYPRDMSVSSPNEKIVVDIKRWYGIGNHYYLSIKSDKKEDVREVFTDMKKVESCIEDFIKEHFPDGCEIDRTELDDSVKWHYKQGD